MKYFGCLLLLLCFVSCGAIHVDYDYDSNTDFSSYTTYNYFSDMQTGLSQLDEKRLLNALDITLKSKGLLFSEEADILINIKSNVFRGQGGNTVGVGLGGGGRTIGGGVSIGVPVGGPRLNRELQIDFVDSKKDVLIWQALSQRAFKEGDTPLEKEQKMQELVIKVFEKYPPKSRK